MTSKPIENSYWVIPGKFLAGEYPGGSDQESALSRIKAMEDAGVTGFIDLTSENEDLEPYAQMLTTATHHRFIVQDVSVPENPDQTTLILDTIDHYVNAGEMVYLHCHGGVGRTGTIVGTWLARHGTKGRAALDKLQELWQGCPKSSTRISPETPEQEQYILDWDEDVK